MEETELDLLQQSARGDLKAWGRIVSRYKEAVFGLALGMLEDPHDAQDVVQETFLEAYRSLERFDVGREFRPWLMGIAANLCRNSLRRRRFLRPLRHPELLVGDRNPQQEARRNDRTEKVRSGLQKLDNKYKAPLIMHYYGKLSYAQIAKALDLPLGTVKTRLHRAKEALKEVL